MQITNSFVRAHENFFNSSKNSHLMRAFEAQSKILRPLTFQETLEKAWDEFPGNFFNAITQICKQLLIVSFSFIVGPALTFKALECILPFVAALSTAIISVPILGITTYLYASDMLNEHPEITLIKDIENDFNFRVKQANRDHVKIVENSQFRENQRQL